MSGKNCWFKVCTWV